MAAAPAYYRQEGKTPMSQDLAAAPKSSGLTTLWDVIVAPRSAFAALRDRPTWGWAFLVISVLGLVGAYLLLPANDHVMRAMFVQQLQQNPNMASMTPEKQQQILNVQLTIVHWSWLATPLFVLFGVLIGTVLLLFANALAGGTGNFRKLWALEMNLSIVSFAIYYVLLGVLAQIRGADSFATQRDVMGSIPSLGTLVPASAPKLGAFLGVFDPIRIWGAALLALGLQDVAGFKPRAAWITTVLLYVIGALFALLGAFFQK